MNSQLVTMKILNPLLRIVILFFILNSSAQERPNVILIMADDMGWGDAAYNGHNVIKTPTLDDKIRNKQGNILNIASEGSK